MNSNRSKSNLKKLKLSIPIETIAFPGVFQKGETLEKW